MEFTFGGGGEPSKREKIMVEKYPELTKAVTGLTPSNGNPDDGWKYVEFPIDPNAEQNRKDVDRLTGAIRNRIIRNWGKQFRSQIKPRQEDAANGMNRIWFRVVRK